MGHNNKGDEMKSYSEKFKLELTSKELEIIEYALELYQDSKTDSREVKTIDSIIKKLYSEAYN